MSDYVTSTCEECGGVGNRTDPVTGLALFREYKGRTLCASCRVSARMRDNDYSQ